MKDPRKTLNKILRLILVTVMVLSMTRLTAIAADVDYEASVTTGAGTVNYEKLADAIVAAKANSGATLKLLKDIGTNVCIDGGTFTFDLNGHTIEADTKFDGVAPYTNQFAMNILSGADITLIGSGRIISNGPIDPLYTTLLHCIRNQGTLTVNGPMQIRTNGYKYNGGIYSYGGTLTIHNCDIEVSRYAVEGNSGAQVTINGGNFAGDIGVYGGGNASVNINGGAVTGSSYDVFISDKGGLASVKLGIGSGGAGPSFPGGLSINNLVGLSDLLNPNYYYMKNGNPVDMTGITTEMAGGDVSVGYCDHSSNTNGVPVADDVTHHSLFCSNCRARIKQEQHSITGGICTGCGYGCSHPDVITVDGVVKCANCLIVMVAQVGDSYYARLSDAVAQANAVNGSTLTLLSDVKGDIVVDPGSSFTLDLNGKTLRGTGKSVITIGASGDSAASLIMKSSAGGGKVTGCYHQNAQGTVVVNTRSTFTMESGVISENVVYSGGGVYVEGGTFNMKGGEISGNTADNLGGGVLLVGTSASFTMDGGSIRSNTVTIDDTRYTMEGIYGGGGVYVHSGTFTMNAGTISGNSSTYTRGGGVQVAQGTFVMNGGTIEGNSAAEKGGGVYVMKGENGDPSGTFTVGGSSVISGNTVNGSANNVYLAVPLTIGSNLSPDANIGVTGSMEPTETVDVEIASSGAMDANKAAFISDNNAYSVIRTDNKLYLYLHSHNWVYELDGSDTIKATCHTSNCSHNNGDGGSVRLVVQNAHYTGAAIGASIEGSLTTGAAYNITYNDGSETAPSTVGRHRATLTVTENGVQKQSVTIGYEILSLAPHSHNWVYELEGSDTIKATCHASDCSLRNSDGGSVRLVVQNAHYTGAAIGASIEGSLTTGAVYKITYNDGSKTAPSTVGKHRATLTVTENGVQKQSVSIEYEILAPQESAPDQATDQAISGNANEGESTDLYTDDNGNLWLWAMCLFISGVGICGMTLHKRKR